MDAEAGETEERRTASKEEEKNTEGKSTVTPAFYCMLTTRFILTREILTAQWQFILKFKRLLYVFGKMS